MVCNLPRYLLAIGFWPGDSDKAAILCRAYLSRSASRGESMTPEQRSAIAAEVAEGNNAEMVRRITILDGQRITL